MVDEKGEKRKVLEKIFTSLEIKHPKDSILKFDNDAVKKISGNKFRNQFDVTKCDTPELLPKCMTDKGFFIVHLGRVNTHLSKEKDIISLKQSKM